MGPREEQARSGSATAAARRSGGGEDSEPTPGTTPWGHGRPLGHSRPGSRPRVSLVSDLPAAKCVTSARRSGDTCCRPRHAESRSPSLGPRQAMARGRAVRAAVGQRGPRTRGAGVRAARSTELGPAARRSRGRAGPQCARSRRRWGPCSPGSADSPRAPRLLLANILVELVLVGETGAGHRGGHGGGDRARRALGCARAAATPAPARGHGGDTGAGAGDTSARGAGRGPGWAAPGGERTRDLLALSPPGARRTPTRAEARAPLSPPRPPRPPPLARASPAPYTRLHPHTHRTRALYLH